MSYKNDKNITKLLTFKVKTENIQNVLYPKCPVVHFLFIFSNSQNVLYLNKTKQRPRFSMWSQTFWIPLWLNQISYIGQFII